MVPRWLYLAAGMIGVGALCLVPSQDARRQIALFERLAPKIERAPTLSPDASATINRLVHAARLRPPAGDAPHDARRQAAIERVANALKAKQAPHDEASAGQTD